MDTSELYSNHYGVHLGFWTNWSYGVIRGATITLTRQHGGFLVAFLAIYVGMVGKSFWRLGCFSLHLYFSNTTEQEDGLYHQRQAILRNSDTAQDGAWRLWTSMLAWRKRARRSIFRLLPLILAATLLSTAFGVASVFSSNVTTDTANEVLLKGDKCGILRIMKSNDTKARYASFKPFYAHLANKDLNYGLYCYTNSSSGRDTDGCNTYLKPELPLKADTKAPCPFNETMCKSKNENLVLDTGRIHSLKHLGINSAPEYQFEFRLRHECAPIVTDGFIQTVNGTDVGTVARAFYGSGTNGAFTPREWTYEAPLDFPYNPANGTGYIGASRPEYNLGHMESTAGQKPGRSNPGGATWSPIPELQREDADIYMMFLSAPGIRFTQPVDDPWFSAHTPASVLYGEDGTTRPSWVQDSPINVLACTYQIQYCNPNLPESERCEPLRGQYVPNKKASIRSLFPSKSQQEFVVRAEKVISIDTAYMNMMVGWVGAAVLRARYGLGLGYQGPLPPDQWQHEVAHWTKGELASMQDALVRSANGPPKELMQFLETPASNETEAKTICRNTKIISTKYSSFNVLGISLIFIIGAIIIVLDMCLEPLIAWIHKRRYNNHTLLHKPHSTRGTKLLHAILEWSSTNTLQLQRLAHEEAGYGHWDECDGANPVTRPQEKLGVLDFSVLDKPVLKSKVVRSAGIRRFDTGFDTLVSLGSLENVKVVGEKIEGKEGKGSPRGLFGFGDDERRSGSS